MTAGNDFILGNGDLHKRCCVITELLGKFVSVAPLTLTLAQIKRDTGLNSREINKYCSDLLLSNLIIETSYGCWKLAGAAADLTLEDVYRCAMAKTESDTIPFARQSDHHLSHAADLLLMQAALAINQSVHKHLRQFSLDRLKPATCVPFPVSLRRLSGLNYNESFDLAPAGHSA
ncbi:hypothetical protein [Actimicrobium sp. CCI2.3]|uniref:hypothetical protein n=1 Tax=Actimicrobium sp. CCI2.3 TaxID=3048616 RepID=UPI002AB4C490|nr:hypothetical protein [Actimicrobium sp. CCI2.3]MDY7576564.1 hypothetical protein [Actimicrobium sp. CCI2.3]MEB0021165.1 hypothetical protein [Actimicrobium sp. CCI2.3]